MLYLFCIMAKPKLFTPHWPGGDFLIQLMLEVAILGSCEAFKNSSYSTCKVKAVGSAEGTASTITAMVWRAHGNLRGVTGSQGGPALTAYCISVGVSMLPM